MRHAGRGILGMASAVLLSGCLVGVTFDDDRDRIHGSGITATTSRIVEDFSQVSVSGVGRLVIEQGDVESLTITADDNILPILESDVAGQRLFLGPPSGVDLSPVREIVYRLTVRELDRIDASGVLEVDVLDLVGPRLAVNLSGVTGADVTGEADFLEVNASGVSRFWGRDFFSLEATVVASGVSDVVVNVRDRLNVTASGASTVRYLGQPLVSVNVSGAGTVVPF